MHQDICSEVVEVKVSTSNEGKYVYEYKVGKTELFFTIPSTDLKNIFNTADFNTLECKKSADTKLVPKSIIPRVGMSFFKSQMQKILPPELLRNLTTKSCSFSSQYDEGTFTLNFVCTAKSDNNSTCPLKVYIFIIYIYRT